MINPEIPESIPSQSPTTKNPKHKEGREFHTFEKLIYENTQRIQQYPEESPKQLHERLRPKALNSFKIIQKPTKVITHSYYTFDTSHILGEDTFVLCTSTCKHETPYLLIVGKRDINFQTKLANNKFEYTIYPLGKDLTNEQKNQIYDEM